MTIIKHTRSYVRGALQMYFCHLSSMQQDISELGDIKTRLTPETKLILIYGKLFCIIKYKS